LLEVSDEEQEEDDDEELGDEVPIVAGVEVSTIADE